MNNQLQMFQFNNHALRMLIDENGEPWFIAMDVAEILEYTDAQAMTRRMDDDEVQNRQIVGFGNRGVSTINESGLYSAILGSQKPEAKSFKKWVTSEVLPSIRKQGYYAFKSAFPFETGVGVFSKVDSALLGNLRNVSKAVAEAYLIECGITPEVIADIYKKSGRLSGPSSRAGLTDQSQSTESLVSDFIKDWKQQAIDAPVMPCLGAQALRLFLYWSNRNGHTIRGGENVIMREIYASPGFYGKKMRVIQGKKLDQRRCLMIDGASAPINMSLGEWLVDCIANMETALQRLGA